uniref:AtpZ/AtpI family protein n=1 Tax=Pseudomonas phage RVTF4 TaxID=3236931 RepID=A0AB39CCN4_9VIRU
MTTETKKPSYWAKVFKEIGMVCLVVLGYHLFSWGIEIRYGLEVKEPQTWGSIIGTFFTLMGFYILGNVMVEKFKGDK